MTGTTIDLAFTDAAAEQRFLRTYLPAAWKRFAQSDAWESGWFWAYGQATEYDIGVDGGLVRLVFDGDPDVLVEAERDRWAAVDGLTGWSVQRYDEVGYESLREQQIDAKGTTGGDWEYRYKPLTAKLASAYHDEFGEQLPPAPERTGANPIGIGFYGLVHALFVQCGYNWYEENDTYLRGIESRIRSIMAYRGEDAAREELRRCQASLAAIEEDLDEWTEELEPGSQTV